MNKIMMLRYFSLNFRPCDSEKLELQYPSKMGSRLLQEQNLLQASCQQEAAQNLSFQLSGLDEVEDEHKRSCLTWQ